MSIHNANSVRLLTKHTDDVQRSGRKGSITARFAGGKGAGMPQVKFFWTPGNRVWYWKWHYDDEKAVRSTRPDTWVRAFLRNTPSLVLSDIFVDGGRGERRIGNRNELRRVRENKAVRPIQAATRAYLAKRDGAARKIQHAYLEHFYRPGGAGMLGARANFYSTAGKRAGFL